MTMKPGMQAGITAAGPQLMDKIRSGADAIGTLHDARFVQLNDNTVGLFTTYDGDLDTYVMDFTKHLGDVFDLLLPHTIDSPPLPVEKNVQAFIDWVRVHDLPSVSGVYSAYPTLSVQDIRALAAKG
ncbi:MAG: hypothetical protein AB7U18_05705 [Dehalococcoidia bacterium]